MKRNYHNDKVLRSWIRTNEYIIINKMNTPLVPYTFQNTSGQTSFIDLVLTKSNQKSLINATVVVDGEEIKDLSERDINNYEHIHRTSWPDLNLGDHMAINVEIIAQEVQPKVKRLIRKIDWNNAKQKHIFEELSRKTFDSSKFIERLNGINEHMDRTTAQSSLAVIIDDLNLELINIERNSLAQIYPDIKLNRWKKSKPWFNEKLKRLSLRRKRLRYLKNLGEDHTRELSKIRSEFRTIKKQEITKLKGKERDTLRFQYEKNRNKFWREIGSRKSKAPDVMVGETELVAHYKDLFAFENKSQVNEEFDKEIEEKVRNERKRIMATNLKININMTTMINIMKNLPLNKSPGPVGVRNE